MSFSSSSSASIRKYTDMDKKELKPGDLIEVFRSSYQHWAVYVGGGNVVHLQVPGSDFSSSGSLSGGTGLNGVVLKEKLEKVVGDDKWRVNNLLDHKYKPRPSNDIVKEACSLVDTELEYNILTYNCEHFATEMRYGKPQSRQVQNGVVGAAGLVGAVGAAGIASLVMNAKKM